MSIQEFLEKYKDYYLTAYGDVVCLEVDCKKRNNWPTDEEIKDIKSMSYINIASETDFTTCCCGSASFYHRSIE